MLDVKDGSLFTLHSFRMFCFIVEVILPAVFIYFLCHICIDCESGHSLKILLIDGFIGIVRKLQNYLSSLFLQCFLKGQEYILELNENAFQSYV